MPRATTMAGTEAMPDCTVGTGVAELILPGGERFRSDAPDADDRLSAAVAAIVRLVRHGPHRPEAALPVLTTTTLHSLGVAFPDSAIDATRFRPNLVLDGVPDESGTGYPEPGWIGRRMAMGPLRLRFTERCERCVRVGDEAHWLD